MAKIKVGKVEIHYQRFGSGPDMVLVHGLAANLAFWHRQIVPLLVNDYRVTIYDLRGHGSSGMPEQGYTTLDFAGDLHGLLEETGLDRVHLAGHSLGGAISLCYASLYPEKVRTLSLLDARVQCLQPFKYAGNDAHWEGERESLAGKGIHLSRETPRVLYKLLEELVPMARAGQANLNAISGIMTRSGDWNSESRSARKWRRLVSETTFREDIVKTEGLTRQEIGKVAVPALLAYGKESSCLETLAGLQGLLPFSRTIVHEDLGHFYPVIAPALAVNDIREFISGTSLQGGEG